jgi:carbonic anhydrase/acetyltransferase-like protein (isoleucine patch superfamily)
MTSGAPPRPVNIVGAGNLGGLLADCLEGDPRWKPVAFIDEGKAGGTMRGLPVIGLDALGPETIRAAFLAIGFPEERRRFKQRLDPLGLDWQTFVDRRAMVSEHAQIGVGSLILNFATVASSARIGPFVYVGSYSGVGAGATIGAFVSVMGRASIGGCTVGEGCLIGLNSACGDGAHLGDGVKVAPYTWVRKPAPAQSLVAGSPARIVKQPPSAAPGGDDPADAWAATLDEVRG